MDRYEKEIKHSKWKFYFFFFLFFENGKFRNFNGQKYTLLEEKQNVHTWAQIAASSKRRRWSVGWENSDCASGRSLSISSAKLRNMEREREWVLERVENEKNRDDWLIDWWYYSLNVERVMKVGVRRESDEAELVGEAANEKRSFGFQLRIWLLPFATLN